MSNNYLNNSVQPHAWLTSGRKNMIIGTICAIIGYMLGGYHVSSSK